MDETAAKQVETDVMTGLEAETPDFGQIFERLDSLPKRKYPEIRSACAEMAADKALELDDIEHWLAALSRADLVKDKEDQLREKAVTTITENIGKSPEIRACLEHSGLTDEDDSFADALHRMSQLLKLQEGVLVYDRTWGAGVVTELDPFYGRITVDFDKKKFHELGMRYASEALVVLRPDHLLSRFKNETETVQEEIAKEPGNIVRQALNSFGPMSVAVLQETITEHFIPASKWKKFWEGARRDLKKDPKVKISTKRDELIEIAEVEESYDEGWFKRLRHARRIPEIFEKLDDLRDNFDGDLDDEAREAIGNRLAHIVKGSMNRPELEAQALLYAFHFGGELPGFDVEKVKSDLIQEGMLPRLFDRMNVKEANLLLEEMMKREPERLSTVLVNLVPQLDSSTLQTTFQLLENTDSHSLLLNSVREQIAQRETAPDLMLWLWKNRSKYGEELINLELLLDLTMISLEAVEEGSKLKAQNGLRELFKTPAWMQDLLGSLNEADARKLIGRVKESSAWPELDRRSVLGLMIKTRPELGSEMSTKTEDSEEDKTSASQITSLRSYEERQKQLNKIINEDIPNNSKEIAVARSYGDLRENFEYQSAKDAQALLMKRQGELQAMLDEVTPTDFSGFPTDVAGPATEIRLRFEDGSEETYAILGVWDQDESLGIISSETEVAKAVMGKAAGAHLTIPSAGGERKGVLVEVNPLSDAVQAWIRKTSS